MKIDSTKFRIAQLIYKSIAEIITDEERIVLDNWLALDTNKALYDTIIDNNAIQNKLAIYNQLDKEKIYKRLEGQMHKDLKISNRKTYLSIFKYAAAAVVLMCLGYIYQQQYFSNEPKPLADSDKITLQLENGIVAILEEDGSAEVVDTKGNVLGTQKGNQLRYTNTTVKETLVYNTLTIPYGKRFQITLSDGTKVHMNAGSSLKYPVRFIEGEKRQVYLSGEAYFSVTEDVNHPFIVNAENLNIEVLGTEFNVSAYAEDKFAGVVLVKGSVGLYTDNNVMTESSRIVPGVKGTLNKANQDITKEVVDTSIYTSWRYGNLIFRNMSFENITKKLERHYNIEIEIAHEPLKSEFFNANFKDEPIEKVLSYFNDSYDIQYTIEDGVVIIE